MIPGRLRLLLSRVRRALWFQPALYAAAALGALVLAPLVAARLPGGLMALIGLDGVYDLLTALASTLLAVATFSLGILAASLRAASQAATPRVRPLLAEDPTARNAISTFIGGFVFAVAGIVILSTGYYSDAAKVLMFGVTCLLILALIVALVRWIGRLGRLGGVAEAIDLVEETTARALAALAAEPHLGGIPAAAPPGDADPLHPDRPGILQAIDVGALAAAAEDLDADLHLRARPGALVGPGRPLLLASRPLDEDGRRRLRDAFVVGPRRTFEADPLFGLEVLSEIGQRALSPAVNDPGTAVEVATAATRLLCGWSRAAADAAPATTHPRLHVPPVTPEALVRDAFARLLRDGAGAAEVQARVLEGLAMLATQDPLRLGPPARAMAAEGLARAARAGLSPREQEELRRLARPLEGEGAEPVPG